MPRTSKTITTKRVSGAVAGGATKYTDTVPTASVTKRVTADAALSTTDRIPETFRFLLLEDTGFFLLENGSDFLLDEF